MCAGLRTREVVQLSPRSSTTFFTGILYFKVAETVMLDSIMVDLSVNGWISLDVTGAVRLV